ncbi:Uncharacterized protein Fot_05023 [Forsythia ovata]|uniref:Uncharacterized protein n=1 Tax=Forsythia ovata TaxID=205694 RepID=A0ABD1WP11_9LAMI
MERTCNWTAGRTRACSWWNEEAIVKNMAEALSVLPDLPVDFWSMKNNALNSCTNSDGVRSTVGERCRAHYQVSNRGLESGDLRVRGGILGIEQSDERWNDAEKS